MRPGDLVPDASQRREALVTTTKALYLRRRLLEAERTTRTVREACREEPADVAVISESLRCNGTLVDVARHRRRFEHVMEHGR